MCCDDSVTNAKSQARSLPYRLGCVKGIEYPFWPLDSRSVVSKINNDTVGFRTGRDLEDSATFFLQRVDRIQNNVVEHL